MNNGLYINLRADNFLFVCLFLELVSVQRSRESYAGPMAAREKKERNWLVFLSGLLWTSPTWLRRLWERRTTVTRRQAQSTSGNQSSITVTLVFDFDGGLRCQGSGHGNWPKAEYCALWIMFKNINFAARGHMICIHGFKLGIFNRYLLQSQDGWGIN